MTQLELDTPRARRTDPGTSHAAAGSVDRDRLPSTQRAILTMLQYGGPMTDEQMWDRWHEMLLEEISPSGLRTRRAELVAKGFVRDTGWRRSLRTGRSAIVWEAVA